MDRLQRFPEFARSPVPERIERPEGAGGGGPEPLLQGFHEFEIVLDDDIADEAAREVAPRVNGAQRLQVDHLRLGSPRLDGHRVVLEFPEARRHVEDLIVQKRSDQLVQFPASDRRLFLQLAEPLLEHDSLFDRDLDVLQVGGQVGGKRPQPGGPLADREFR